MAGHRELTKYRRDNITAYTTDAQWAQEYWESVMRESEQEYHEALAIYADRLVDSPEPSYDNPFDSGYLSGCDDWLVGAEDVYGRNTLNHAFQNEAK